MSKDTKEYKIMMCDLIISGLRCFVDALEADILSYLQGELKDKKDIVFGLKMRQRWIKRYLLDLEKLLK